MDEQEPKRTGASRYLWLLLLLAIVLLWWYFRPDSQHKVAQLSDDDAAQAIDRDDVLVDLKDDTTPAQIAALDRDFGIDLQPVDQSGEAAATKLFRAAVDPSREDALVQALSARPEVEIAEPDSFVTLSPEPGLEVTPDAQEKGFP